MLILIDDRTTNIEENRRFRRMKPIPLRHSFVLPDKKAIAYRIIEMEDI